MSRLIAIFSVVVLLAGPAFAEEPTTATTTTATEAVTTTTEPPMTEPPPQDTKVLGTPPNLVGHWLAVAWIAMAEQGKETTAAIPWEITEHDGQLDLKELYVVLPKPLQDALDQANGTQQGWKPSAADIDRLNADWDNLQVLDSRYAASHHEIAGPDGLPEEVKKEERSKDAILMIRQRHDASPRAVPLIRQVQVWSATKKEGGGYTGNFDGASLAAVPFPVPIQFKGTFKLYPVGKPPDEPGMLTRLLDAFRGCGK